MPAFHVAGDRSFLRQSTVSRLIALLELQYLTILVEVTTDRAEWLLDLVRLASLESFDQQIGKVFWVYWSERFFVRTMQWCP